MKCSRGCDKHALDVTSTCHVRCRCLRELRCGGALFVYSVYSACSVCSTALCSVPRAQSPGPAAAASGSTLATPAACQRRGGESSFHQLADRPTSSRAPLSRASQRSVRYRIGASNAARASVTLGFTLLYCQRATQRVATPESLM